MKIELSARLTTDMTADLARKVAERMGNAGDHQIVDSHSVTDVDPGQEADFTVNLVANPYLTHLLRADRLNAARALELAVVQLREALNQYGVGVETVYAQIEPQGTNAHSDAVFLTV